MTAIESQRESGSPHRLGARITGMQRDLAEFAFRHRVVSRDQAKARGGFRSRTRVNACLASAVAHDVLSRKQIPVYPGKGSAQALYYPGKASGTLLGVEPEELRRVRRQISRWSWTQVRHVLATNQVLVDFMAALRRRSGAELARYRTEPELRSLLLGRRLVPDGWLCWKADGAYFNCFLEIDLGSEGLAVWRGKVLGYLEYADAAAHQRLFGFKHFRVLVLAESASRLFRLRQISVQAGRMFLFALLGEIDPETILGRTWAPALGDVRIALDEA